MPRKRPDDYAVGYGKPPKHTQFKPGQSGNPNGRPRGSKSFRSRVMSEGNRMITVTEGGKPVKMRKDDLIVRQLVNKAAAGDRGFMDMYIKIREEGHETGHEREQRHSGWESLSAKDAKILSELAKDDLPGDAEDERGE